MNENASGIFFHWNPLWRDVHTYERRSSYALSSMLPCYDDGWKIVALISPRHPIRRHKVSRSLGHFLCICITNVPIVYTFLRNQVLHSYFFSPT